MKNENVRDSKSVGETAEKSTPGGKTAINPGRNTENTPTPGGKTAKNLGRNTEKAPTSDGKTGKNTANTPATNPKKSTPDKNPANSHQPYPGFDENMFPTTDAKLSIAPTRPFTKYRAVEMGLCVAAIILGLLYLYTDLVTLTLLLPAFSVGMTVITALRFLDGREALAQNSDNTGKIGKTAAYFPAVFSGFLTAVVIIVTIAYFSGAAR